MPSERIQKILAKAGLASRRKAEEWIAEGLVTVNGKIARLGEKAVWGRDAIKVKGKLLLTQQSQVYLAFNKPKGVISMLSDPEGRPTLKEFLEDVSTKVFPVGRLDFNSEGLILLTNDGDFAEKLLKEGEVPRVYHVKIKGHPEPEALSRLSRGGRIGKRSIQPYSVKVLRDLKSKSIVEFVVLGAGAIDVKSFFENKGFLIEKITRVSIGHITLKNLLPGKFRYLKKSQVYALLNQPELGLRDMARATSRRSGSSDSSP